MERPILSSEVVISIFMSMSLSPVFTETGSFIYNLCFGLSKLYTNIQQDHKAKLDYHMEVVLK